MIYLKIFKKEKFYCIYDKSLNFVYIPSNSTCIFPVGPCLCFPIKISAKPAISFILDCHSACSIDPSLGCFFSS